MIILGSVAKADPNKLRKRRGIRKYFIIQLVTLTVHKTFYNFILG
jgi:hypothetical protein